MSKIARIHHYVPQSYLAAFTDTGTIDGYLFVSDVQNGNSFRSLPKRVAAERDFNRISIDGKSPDVMEHEFSDIEDLASKAIREVISTENFPCDNDYTYILNLICLLAVRNPKRRESFNRSRENMEHQLLEALVSNKKIWDSHLKRAQEKGYINKSEVPYEDIKKFINERRYKIKFDTGGNLQIELQAGSKLLSILHKRTWSVVIAPAQGPSLVCSDHPVVLTRKYFSRLNPVGYSQKNTEVFFPLSPRVGFYGVYEDPLPPVVKMTPKGIAIRNACVFFNAKRHFFSYEKNYYVWYKGEIREVNCGRTL